MKRTSLALRGWLFVSCTLLVVGLLFRQEGLLRAGLLMLTVMPLGLLLVVTGQFVRHKDATFATISIGVLLLLTLSLMFASR